MSELTDAEINRIKPCKVRYGQFRHRDGKLRPCLLTGHLPGNVAVISYVNRGRRVAEAYIAKNEFIPDRKSKGKL